MKKFRPQRRFGLGWSLGLWLVTVRLVAGPVGSDFTYQGHLSSAGTAANGSFDLRFSLHDAATGGGQIGSVLTNPAVAVSNGLFTASLDFGAGAFDGQARWLELAVRSGTNDFTVLSPRQAVAAAPYALTALTVSGPVQLTNGASTVVGSFFGNGAGLTNLDTSTFNNWVLGQGYQTTNGVTRRPLATPAPVHGTNYVVDFLSEAVQIVATNQIYFQQSTNRPADGWYGESVWYLQGGATNYTLKFNPNWVGVGTLAASSPYLLLSNKLTIVAVSVRGPSETNVTYAIARQE